MQVSIHKNCERQFNKLQPKIQAAFERKLVLFVQHPFALELKNHKLHGKLEGKRSINITGDVRAVYEELPNGNVAFLTIGTHHELYGT